jgi:hypothetical protein
MPVGKLVIAGLDPAIPAEGLPLSPARLSLPILERQADWRMRRRQIATEGLERRRRLASGYQAKP